MAKSEKTLVELDAEIEKLKKQREVAVTALGNRIADTLIKKRGIKTVKGFTEWYAGVEKLESELENVKFELEEQIKVTNDLMQRSEEGHSEPEPVEPVAEPVRDVSELQGFGNAENAQR